MSRYTPSLELVPRIAAGEVAAIARMISRAEAGLQEAREALAAIYRGAGGSHVIGITGVPGSGKSTLVAKLVEMLRADGGKVGVIAIDPSSPYSGGAILGDRIRMSALAGDPGVYVRSMATRGATGGMARAALDAIDILDCGGYRTIIVETVGVGQDEVEIARASHTTVVVSAPGLGDEIQAIKAGILEIADIHVVSKSDRSDAARTLADLKQMLALGLRHGAKPEWQIPVIGVSSITGDNLDVLLAALRDHHAFAQNSETGLGRRARIAEFRLRKTAESLLLQHFNASAAAAAPELAAKLAKRDGDPYSLAVRLVAATFRDGAIR
jgi:LAO/AO transport system kinase